jgi:hypothetical protein
MIRRRSLSFGGILAILVVIGAGRADIVIAQEVRTAIVPDTILVGDVFRAAIRLELPPGWTMVAPDSLATSGEVENAGPAGRTTRERPDGGSTVTLAYPVTAWRTGEVDLPPITIVLNGPDGAEELSASFPVVLIRSVLPADTAGVEPQPPKDVFGPSRLLWPWIVGALTLAATLAGLIYYRSRRRAGGPALTFDIAESRSPRERALAELDRLRGEGLVEAGETKEFYSGTTAVLRAFLEEFDSEWGAELTSTELLNACRGSIHDSDLDGLAQLLDAADQVKFNRRQTAPAEAFGEWEAVRRWVDQFQLPPPNPRSPIGPEENDADAERLSPDAGEEPS